MADDVGSVGDEPSEAVPEPPQAGKGRTGGSKAPSRRGFRSQPLALKVLLIASLSALAAGVVRCSIEMTAVGPPVSRIGVERALVDLDEGIFWAPADSVSARVARVFTEALRDAGAVDARLAPPGASGFDAIARLRISRADGGVRVAVGIVDASSGRALLETSGEGAPEMLPGVLTTAAVRIARELGIAEGGGTTRGPADRESGGA